MGLALNRSGQDYDALYAQADRALYRAKEGGAIRSKCPESEGGRLPTTAHFVVALAS